MSSKTFINLPVKNLAKSKEFFSKLGFNFDAHFTNDKGACMIISEESYVMLVVEDLFKTFTKREISDANRTTEVIVAISLDSREEVDIMVHSALEAGAKKSNDPINEATMYTRSFQDLDSHLWEVFYMDPTSLL